MMYCSALEKIGVGVCLFADDDARAMRHLAVAHDREFEIGNIHLDPFFAEVARQPAPPLHIGDDFGFDSRG